MYVIAVLLMLKLYQQRHPDITASADSVFIVLACSVSCRSSVTVQVLKNYLMWQICIFIRGN
jgi:hypothetical protein